MKNKNEQTKEFHRWASFMTYFHMIGGLMGLLVTFLLLRTDPLTGHIWLLIALQSVLFSLIFYCGYAFLNKDYKLAIQFSTYMWLLQLVPFDTGNIGYLFFAGLGALVKFGLTDHGITYQFGISKFELADPSFTGDFVGINLIAIFILFGLFRLQKDLNTH